MQAAINLVASPSAAQMANQTSDIVWLVEQTVTLADGSTQRVLVRQVYVRVQPGDIDGSGNTSDSRMQALGAAAAALNTYNTVNKVAEVMKDPVKAATSVGFNISIGSSNSQSNSTETSNTARGSSVGAGGNVSITASGAGKDSNILIQGSDVTAGNNARLLADGAVTLQAAQNTVEQHSTNGGSSASIGIGINFGSQSGISLNASASQSRGNADGQDLVQSNTHITAGNTASVTSGGDTTLEGATVTANTVKADVGGNLNIESLQDTSTYTSQQQSSGGGVSLCIPPLCYGTSSVSVSGGKSNIDSNFASVTEQSGIKAGDGGFQVTVKNDTDLKGGAITSTDKAVDEGKNSFTTGGALTTSDIQNKADYKGDGYNINASLGFKAGDQSSGTTPEQVAASKAAPTNSGSAGIGRDSGNASSVTQAAISGIAGNKDARTGDAEAGIPKIFDAARVQREIDAQVAITAEFGKQASKAVGDLAQKKYDELKASDPEEAAKWAEGGIYRSLAHAAIGGVTGGLQGAAGAGLASLSADAINKATSDLPEGVKNVVGAAIAMGIGATAGGATGAATAFNSDMNNRQLHPTEAQLIKDNAKRFAQRLYGKSAPSAEQIKAAEAMLANTAQSLLDNNLGYFVSYSKEADDFLQTLKIEYMQQNGSLTLEGTQGQQQLFYAAVEQKNQPWLNQGLADAILTGLIVKTPISAAINNPTNDSTRDRLTGLPLDEKGRYAVSVSVDGKNFEPKYFPCATSSCIASGKNLDMTDPGTQNYVKAVDKMIMDDINKGATFAAVVLPAGVVGGVASVVGPLTSIAAGMVEDQSLKAIFKEGLQAVAGLYIQKIYGFTKELATRVTGLVDSAGGWQAFVDRVQGEIEKDKK